MRVFKGILILMMCVAFGFVPLYPVYKQAPEYNYYIPDGTVGADGVVEPMEPMEQPKSNSLDFDFKNAIVGGVFGYLLTNALDLTKKLFGFIVGLFTRRKK